jgi:hypothetical protein
VPYVAAEVERWEGLLRSAAPPQVAR